MLQSVNLNDAYALIICSITIIISILIRRRHFKRVWTRKWIASRPKNGVYHQLLKELENEDQKSLKNFLRMDKQAFLDIVKRIRPFVQKQNTWWRPAISVEERLALTLRFLATGKFIN